MERTAVSERLEGIFEELRRTEERIKACIEGIGEILGEYDATDTVAEIKRTKFTVVAGKSAKK